MSSKFNSKSYSNEQEKYRKEVGKFKHLQDDKYVFFY